MPVIGTLPLGDLKPLQVDEWIWGLRERGLGSRTIEDSELVAQGDVLQFHCAAREQRAGCRTEITINKMRIETELRGGE